MEAKAAFDVEADSFRATELRLGLPGTVDQPGQQQKPTPARGGKRTLAEAGDEGCRSGSCCTGCDCDGMEDTSPPAKGQVVGWPPIRSYRKNCLQSSKDIIEGEVPGLYVKVGMDGAPYLRKIDLNMFRGYKELREGLEAMFECFSIGFSAGEEGRRPTSDYAITYEDKDGDWMLAGDVPWEMFTSSCRRLRIMKGSDARGFGSS